MTARKVKRLALLSAACLLLAGVFLWLLNQQPAPPSVKNLVFSNRTPTDIDNLTVSNDAGGFTISYQEDPAGYVVDDVPADLLDMDRFISLMVSQAGLAAKTRLAEPLSPLSDYGLGKPRATVSLTFVDGSQLGYSLGGQELVSGDYYLQVGGVDGIFTYPKADAQALLSNSSSLVSLQVTPSLTVSSPLSAVRDATFSGKHLPEPLSIHAVLGGSQDLRTKALTFGAATHLVQGRGLHPLDQQNGIRVLGSLLGIQAIKVVQYNVSQQDLVGYGFDEPDMQVDFSLAKRESPEEAISLLLLQAGADQLYALRSDRDVVYLINRPAFWDLHYQDLILRYFAAPMLADIKGISITGQDQSYQITFSRDENRQAHATVNGETVDIELFYAFYRLLTSAAADGRLLDGAGLPGEPALSIVYHYQNPDKTDDSLLFIPHGIRRMAVSVNGVILQDIRESFVTRLLAACENLVAGKPIEETW